MGKRKSPTNDNDGGKKNKRPPNAYALFLKSSWEKEENKGSYSAFTKVCAALWFKMTDDEKKKFKDEASALKEKWNGEKEKPETKKSEPKKKRTPGPYIMFCSDMRAKIKEENPEFSMTQISKELGRLWNELADEERAKYHQKANEEREKSNDKGEGKSEIEETLKKKEKSGKDVKVGVSS